MVGLVGDLAEWAGRKAAETAADVFDIGGASGNNSGSNDWEAWGHPDIYSMVQSSIDPVDVQGGADVFRAIGTRIGESFATFSSDLNGIVRDGWRGASADAASAANAPIEQWGAQLSEAVTRTSDLMTTSGESVEQTKRSVPPPVEFSVGQSLRSAGTGLLAGGPVGAMFGAGADAVVQDRARDDARAQAIQVMNSTYSAPLASTMGSVPTAFPQLTDPTQTPPEVDPRQNSPDSLGKPSPGSGGGPGDGGAGGPGDAQGDTAAGGGGTGGGTTGVPGGGGTGGQLPGRSQAGPAQTEPAQIGSAQTGGQFAPPAPGGAGGSFGPSSPGGSAGGMGGALAPAAFGPVGAGGDRVPSGGRARGVGAGAHGAGGSARAGSGGRFGGGAGGGASAGGGFGGAGGATGGAAGRAGAGGAGRGVMPMAGMAGGAARGPGGDDSEHQRKFMIEADPDAIVGQIDPVAPPVIGEDPDVYQRRDG